MVKLLGLTFENWYALNYVSIFIDREIRIKIGIYKETDLFASAVSIDIGHARLQARGEAEGSQ